MSLEFSTERLQVKEWSQSADIAEFMSLLSQIPDLLTPAVVKSLPPYFHGIENKTAALNWFTTMVSESRLFVVNNDRSTIGFLFAHLSDDNNAHIGYLLGEAYWGQGFASELLKGFIRYVEAHESWQKLIGGVEQENIASARLLLKLGFIEQPSEDNQAVFFEYQLK